MEKVVLLRPCRWQSKQTQGALKYNSIVTQACAEAQRILQPMTPRDLWRAGWAAFVQPP